MTDVNPEERSIAVVFSTCPTASAEALASFLVRERHAACVNVLPQVQSVYRWQGKIERDAESLLIVKCAAHAVDDLVQALESEHPYDVPEVIVLPVIAGNAAYLRWVHDARRPASGPGGGGPEE